MVSTGFPSFTDLKHVSSTNSGKEVYMTLERKLTLSLIGYWIVAYSLTIRIK